MAMLGNTLWCHYRRAWALMIQTSLRKLRACQISSGPKETQVLGITSFILVINKIVESYLIYILATKEYNQL